MYKGFRCIAQWHTENEAADQQVKKELENYQKEGLVRQLSTAWGGMSFQSFEMPVQLMCWLSIMYPALQFSLEWARMDLSEHGTRGYYMGNMT